MKIGFVVSFFDFRNDVRKVIEILSGNHDIVVFFKSTDETKVLNHRIGNVEYRPIIERNKSVQNRILEQLFLYFKKLPKSRNNYFLMELFKISNLTTKKSIKRARFILLMQRLLPRIVGYDLMLKHLKPICKTQIDDIDRFIFFSEVADDYFFARLAKEKKQVKFYVYSWDHPFKHTRFPAYPEYFCWSLEIKNDFAEMQHISTSKITVSGACQLGYVYDFNKKLLDGNLKRSFAFDYIYFGCALGIRELVPQEMAIVKQIAETMLRLRPDLKLVVRPYPVLEQWELYEEMRCIPNIIMDDGFRGKDLSIKDEYILQRFEKIHFAKAFLHLGTTMGLEACFTVTPSFIIDFSKKNKTLLSLYSFTHQTQNEKYLIEASTKNTLKSIDDFELFLKDSDSPVYRDLNKKVTEQFPVISFQKFSERLSA